MHVPAHLQSLFWKPGSITTTSKVLWIGMLAAVPVTEGEKIQALLTPISSVTVNEMCNNHTREHYQLLTRMRQLPMSWPARWSHTLARGGGSRCSAECRILQRKQPCNEEKVQQWDFFLISKVSVFIDIYFSSETSLGGHTPKHWWLLPQSFTLTSVLFRCATMSTSS